MKGKVLWWNPMMVRGFIISETGQQVYFTGPASEKDADLDSGDEVTFDPVERPDGLHARNVRRTKMLEAKAGERVNVGGGYGIHVSESNVRRARQKRKSAEPRKRKRKGK